jgi:hypothetical protein
VTPPPAAPRTVARAQVVALGEVYWSKLDPPAVPLTMQVGSSAAKGECYLERDRSGKGNGMIRGSYALSTGRVHRNSLLHVRLINPAGLSYAEFKRSLPVLTERQGVDLAMPVPGEWLAEMGTVLVELTPGEVVEDAVALEPVQWRFTVQNASEQLRVVTLSVRNTSDRPVRELHFGLDAVDEQGALVGSWHGKVEATIGPGKSIDFEAYVTTPHFITSDRLSLRAYGLPEPPPMDMGELMLQALKAYGLVSPSASSSPSP